MSYFNLYNVGLRVTCPTSWEDEDAEAVADAVEAILESRLNKEALQSELQAIHPELQVTISW